MKKILIPTLIIFLSLTSIALAKKPVKIARLPIIIQNNRLDYETAAALEMKMARAVKVPMNNTLKTYEYLPPRESEKILGRIWQEMYAKDKKAQISDAIKIFADETDADLVICPILRYYSQRVSPVSFSFETHLSSIAKVELIIYDRDSGELIDKKDTRRFNDSYNRFGTASYLAGECFDQVIKESNLRQIIHDKRG